MWDLALQCELRVVAVLWGKGIVISYLEEEDHNPNNVTKGTRDFTFGGTELGQATPSVCEEQ